MADSWLEPAGGPEQWRKLNKYKDGRRVLYICDYVDLLDNDDYLSLPEPTALLLHRLWKAFAKARGHLPNDTRRLSQACGQRVTKPMIERLIQAGFFRVSVTRPSRTRYGFVTTRAYREELEVEVETPQTPLTENTKPPTPTKAIRAIRAIINGQSWDPQATDPNSMLDEFTRTTRRVSHIDLEPELADTLLNEWKAERDRRLNTSQ